ncbi:NAD(P)H-binding protein [Streptomyces sp. NPDC093707]|uniref:NAD(P)H-binding protein n=1 Tax=Streptomyces sp. NPDC093707 TaxID=3154984 RepID=UPI00344DA97C
MSVAKVGLHGIAGSAAIHFHDQQEVPPWLQLSSALVVVGRHVADGLPAAGEQVGAVSRTPAAGLTPGWEAAAADLDRPETLPAVLDDADKVFLHGMLNPQKPYDIEKFAASATAAGIRQVVLLSSVSVVLDPDADHPAPRLNRTGDLVSGSANNLQPVGPVLRAGQIRVA